MFSDVRLVLFVLSFSDVRDFLQRDRGGEDSLRARRCGGNGPATLAPLYDGKRVTILSACGGKVTLYHSESAPLHAGAAGKAPLHSPLE
jgi:hypothetical protein